MQCDLWFPEPRILLGDGTMVMLPVLVMVASFSKFITAVMIPSRTTADLLAGMWALLSEQLGAVPRRLIWDNETGIGRRNRLAAGVGGFAGALATKIHQLKAYDPESKGGVERINGYFETSFLPGREFASPGDFNTQLGIWLPKANARTVRALKARPVDLVGYRQGCDARAAPGAHRLTGSLLGSGCPGTTTSGSSATTTRSIPARSGGWSTSSPTWTWSRPARRSPGRRPPTLVGHRIDDHRPRPCQRGSPAARGLPGTSRHYRPRPTWCCATSPTTTPRSASTSRSTSMIDLGADIEVA